MKIGFPNNPQKEIISEIRWIADNDFDFVDLFLEHDMAVPEKIDVDEIKNLLEENDLDVVGHTAWYLPIGSPIRKLREASVEEVERHLPIFSEVGVEYVTIHSNWHPGRLPLENKIGFQVSTLEDIKESAAEYDLEIMLELGDRKEDSPENIRKIIDGADIYFHLDTGHANLYDREPVDYIEEFKDELKHVHLNDNFGITDLHIPIGTGWIEWEETLGSLKEHHDGTITLEIFSRDKDYVLLSKEKLEAILGE